MKVIMFHHFDAMQSLFNIHSTKRKPLMWQDSFGIVQLAHHFVKHNNEIELNLISYNALQYRTFTGC